MKRIDRMTQRKRISLMKIRKNAYRMEIVQKDNSSRNCKKCEVSFKNQEKFQKAFNRRP